ncbi:hypothetical protein MMC20_005582 [Loxospora ochrophaea]|nr:hypothetical protein [Loxospora ochrophaea]
MPQLPLKLRLDVRDQWENEKSAVQKSLSELSQLVGLKVNVLLEMPMIWTELQKHFPDQGTFVPNIIGVVKTWTDCLIARLEDEANAEWTERLLDEVQEASKILRARVQVSLSAE